MINTKFTPDSTECLACVASEDGAVPSKAEWKSYADDRSVLSIVATELKQDKIATAQAGRERRHKQVGRPAAGSCGPGAFM